MSAEHKNPRTGNTGVVKGKNVIYSYALDWLRFSVGVETDRSNLLPKWDVFGWDGEMNEPFKNYNRSIKLRAGRIDWHTEQPQQKQLVTLTGADLRAIEQAGESIPELIAHVTQHETLKVSRLDFAMDIRDSGGKPAQLFKRMKAHKCKTRAKSALWIEKARDGKNDGETCYIGDRTSPKFLRLYDKAREQKSACDWLRMEIEIKDQHARNTARAMANYGLIEGGKAAIRQYIMTGLKWIDNGLADGFTGAYVAPVPDEHGNSEAWLMNIALPAVLEAIRTDHSDVRRRVADEMRQAYKARLWETGSKGDRLWLLREAEVWQSP